MTGFRRYLLRAAIVGGVLALAVVSLGIARYGGVDGLRRRVNTAVGVQRPRPTAAPTLQPAATVDVAAFTAALVAPSATPTIWPTFTPIPTSAARTATPWPTRTPPPPPTETPSPDYPETVYLDGYRHHWQDWNNCAPATLTTLLTFYGKSTTQAETAAQIKPNADDKNVTPAELVPVIERHGLQGRVLINGSSQRLKALLNAGYPIMVETWLEDDEAANDGMGHYRLVVGYDDRQQEWIVSDSYVSEDVELPYRGIRIGYEDFDRWWRVFNRLHLVVYRPEAEAEVAALVGAAWDETGMHSQALDRLRMELEDRPEDALTWHNIGTVLAAQGRMESAVAAFDQARTLGLPWRMFWYQFDVFAAYTAVGRHQDVLDLATATIESGGGGEEVYYWRGRAYEALGDSASAEAAWRYALWWHPGYEPAQTALGG